MALGFLIFWVVVGALVFFVAVRGGPRGARASLSTDSRAGRRAVLLAVAVVIASGVAVPALVLAFNGAHKSRVAPGGVTLTRAEQHGRTLFAQACATCHTLKGAAAFGRVGPNLDVLRPPKALVLDAIANGRARGMGQMPALLFQGQDAQDVASFVAAVAGR